MSEDGLPGLRGTDHIGFTVPDLDAAVDFFVNVIGCEAFYDLGPFQFDDDWMQRQLNVHPRAVMRRLKFLRCRHGSNFEIFEYEAPDQNTSQPKNSDIGGHHLAFYVDDMDAALAYLREKGVRILGEPVVRTEGPSAGQTWVPRRQGLREADRPAALAPGAAGGVTVLPFWKGGRK
jgi:catechol 2,3-dioxygenase-like lactoylglutathione lyase family enzyme